MRGRAIAARIPMRTIESISSPRVNPRERAGRWLRIYWARVGASVIGVAKFVGQLFTWQATPVKPMRSGAVTPVQSAAKLGVAPPSRLPTSVAQLDALP